jgi:hypothetical protein
MPRANKTHLSVEVTKSDMQPRSVKKPSVQQETELTEEEQIADLRKNLQVIRRLEEEKLREEIKGQHKQQIIDMLLKCRADLEKKVMLYEKTNKNASKIANYIGHTTTQKRKNEIIKEEENIFKDQIKEYGLEHYANLVSSDLKKKR